MGRDERHNKMLTQQELERTIGPRKPFGSRDIDGCQKCGGQQLVKRFCVGKSLINPNSEGCQFVGEHLHTICVMCQYGWLEQTKDADPSDNELMFGSAGAETTPGA